MVRWCNSMCTYEITPHVTYSACYKFCVLLCTAITPRHHLNWLLSMWQYFRISDIAIIDALTHHYCQWWQWGTIVLPTSWTDFLSMWQYSRISDIAIINALTHHNCQWCQWCIKVLPASWSHFYPHGSISELAILPSSMHWLITIANDGNRVL